MAVLNESSVHYDHSANHIVLVDVRKVDFYAIYDVSDCSAVILGDSRRARA